jgi:two-component system, cell cycle sensor histidine kinase and response regulator CckA
MYGGMDERGATVLIVEDHDSVRIAISRFLKAGGFEPIEAESPEAAKAVWANHRDRISLLLVDIDLPRMSGPDLVDELQPSVPVIFATATDDARSSEATRNFDNPTILQKPFSPEVLVNAVRDALAAPSALSGFTTFFKRPK